MDAEHRQSLELSRDDLLRMLDEGEPAELTRAPQFHSSIHITRDNIHLTITDVEVREPGPASRPVAMSELTS